MFAAVQIIEDAIWILMGGGKRGHPRLWGAPTPILGQQKGSDKDKGEEGKAGRWTERAIETRHQRQGQRKRHTEIQKAGTHIHTTTGTHTHTQ